MAQTNSIQVGRDGDWSVCNGIGAKAMPLAIRFNTAFAQFARTQDFPNLVEVSLTLNSPNYWGLPEEPEEKELWSVEESLNQALAVNGKYLPVALITGEGLQKYVYYTSDSETNELSACLKGITTHKVSFLVRADPQWSTYKSLMPGQTAEGDEIEEFWSWFESNEQLLLEITDSKDPLISALRKKIRALNSGLDCEISVDDVPELTIGAHCDESLFDLAQLIIASSPELSSWVLSVSLHSQGCGHPST